MSLATRMLAAGCLLSVAAAAIPIALLLNDPPVQAPLAERIVAARADITASPCATDSDCQWRIADHGLDPDYFAAPDDWLESGCRERHDSAACAYLSAWRAIGPER